MAPWAASAFETYLAIYAPDTPRRKENQLTLSENLLLQLVLYSETAIFILCYFQIKSPVIFRLVFLSPIFFVQIEFSLL